MYRVFSLLAILALIYSSAHAQTTLDAADSPGAIEITVFKSPL